jgi:predicted transcriptional regulator
MNCTINQTIRKALEKGKKLEVIKRYLQLKHRINMDVTSLKERVRSLNNHYTLSQ